MKAIRVSAPGSIMLIGEHAVVYGHPAIVCAIEQRAYVKATPLDMPVVEINSEITDPVSIPLSEIAATGPLRFVQAAVLRYRDTLNAGIRFDIHSEINPTLGLGSSAAVTSACLGALRALTNPAHEITSKDLTYIHQQALEIVREIQGRGSGADLAASIFGAMLSYQLTDQGANIAPLPAPPELSLKYAGYKTPTAEVLAMIAEKARGQEEVFNAIYRDMGRVASAAISATRIEDWASFGEHLNAYQTLMVRLGVSDETLDAMISEARTNPSVLASKISGSGLGDCVVAIGATPEGFTPAHLAQDGLIFEKLGD